MSYNHSYDNSLIENNYSYKRLIEEHEDIELMLMELDNQLATDRVELVMLKKQKLKIQDKLAAIERQAAQSMH